MSKPSANVVSAARRDMVDFLGRAQNITQETERVRLLVGLLDWSAGEASEAAVLFSAYLTSVRLALKSCYSEVEYEWVPSSSPTETRSVSLIPNPPLQNCSAK